ncbi:MAG TPA: hypothetical protein VHO50_02275 [Bacteroidales bacterium]|nr:hypothetical protein [Bacteroidales bacterium]
MAKKKHRTSQPEILQTGQGERLQEFFISKDFKSRNAFAKAIGVSSSSINEVIWGYKLISKNLFAHIKRSFPDIVEEWLLMGEQSINQESHIKVAEDQFDYLKKDSALPQDLLIKQQSKLIDQQRETIEQLIKQIEILKHTRH